MKFRIAKKIYEAIGTPRDVYTDQQKLQAVNRMGRLKSSRRAKGAAQG